MLKKLFQSAEEKRAQARLREINALEPKIKKLSDQKLQNKTGEFRDRLAKGETLDDIRNEVYAVMREATWRVLKKRPFDVQILGALILDMGSVAEMKTGEGKTITSIAPVYLNALEGKGVVVSTVNEYLTQRDAEEMGEVHKFMGLTVGINLRSLSTSEKREAYNCDITYSVHSEIGFDYLRDNMVKKVEDKVQRKLNYALIDEVDSILIDEAKTPLIITGGSKTSSQAYKAADQFVKSLKPEDFDIDWESKGIQLNEKGADKANRFFNTPNIFSIENSELVHRIQNALRANKIMNLDADYIIRENKIEIIDAFTGRIMEGRSFSDGLHQAIQAKENVEIEAETKTMATITYQNLFRMFSKLCGMSGTAKTEENEFIEIYNMRVHVIPTNKPMIRIDHPDRVFVSKTAKYKAIITSIEKHNAKGQPILLGTEEISESEYLSKLLRKKNLKHTVLNAKQNETEAEIIARAGEAKAITIATNMAGRGTDIKPSKDSLKAGGLYVIGTNKAEARRIDNQLKGRSGRQGDVGESCFFLSLDDTLISRFSNQEKLKKLFSSFGEKQITSKRMVSILKRAQIKIEGFNFDSRKNILQYDDVIRQQRDLIYAQRDIIISQEDLLNVIQRMMKSVVKELIVDFPAFKKPDKSIDYEKMVKVLNRIWFIFVDYKLEIKDFSQLNQEELIAKIQTDLIESYDLVRETVTNNTSEETMHQIERDIILATFDKNWELHIDQLSKLRSSSSLASYAQQNPYQIYVEKSAELFQDLLKRISHNTVRTLMTNRYAIKKDDPEIAILKKHIEKKLQNLAKPGEKVEVKLPQELKSDRKTNKKEK